MKSGHRMIYQRPVMVNLAQEQFGGECAYGATGDIPYMPCQIMGGFPATSCGNGGTTILCFTGSSGGTCNTGTAD